MGWFGKAERRAERGGAGAERSLGAAQVGNAWQRMATEVLDTQSEAERAQRERQQRKIIGYFAAGRDPQMITMNDAPENPAARQAVLTALDEGRITDEDERRFLGLIRGPIDTPERGQGAAKIFEKISQDPWQRQLFGFMSEQAEDWDGPAGAEAVRSFVARSSEKGRFDTPMGLRPLSDEVLRQLKPQTSAEQYREYERSMGRLMKTLYGKRYEYYQAFEDLKTQTEWTVFLEDTLPPQKQAQVERAPEPKRKFGEVYKVHGKEAEQILKRTQFEGDPWEQDGQYYQLGPQTLQTAELLPEYETDVEGQKFYFSKMFRLASGRAAVMGYVPTEEGMKLRSYYRSNSQGVWRYLPDYTKEAGSGQIGWFGKGLSEESLTLPFEMQMALATVEHHGGVKRLELNPDFVLAGAAKAYGSKGQYREKLAQGEMRGDYYREVARTAMSTGLERYPVHYDASLERIQKHVPESMVLPEGVKPDFSRKLASFETEASMVGRVRNEVFESQDGQQRWLMCKDDQGRAWVGGVETRSPMTSIGVRRDWVAAGDVGTPLYEYQSQAGGYGDAADTKGRYESMWRNYLSKVPVIREYVAGE